MINLEIFGCAKGSRSNTRAKLQSLFLNQSFGPEITFTFVDSSVESVRGQHWPYVRIWSTDESLAAYVQEVLRLTGFEVERPHLLANFSCRPMWTADEIMTDLILMQQHKRLPIWDEGVLARKAIESLKRCKYQSVAIFYTRAATRMQIALQWSPDREALGRKVDPETENIQFNEDGARRRLTMIKQILYSLLPPHFPRLAPQSSDA